MQTDGTLTRWNPDRGFGFITPRRGGQDIFVPLSAFPQDGRPPQLNEKLSFAIETDKSGKKRAVHVVRLDDKNRRFAHPGKAPWRSRLPALLAPLALLIAIGVYGYVGLYEKTDLFSVLGFSTTTGSTGGSAIQGAATTFFCDGRTTCAQMTSCEEAKFFLRHCPGVTMDDNHDGVPCEEQWCSGVSQ